jgi:exopolyphosphatase/guanosine-5'-triphosphate,3'-diphosphate pyrophosphatase
MFAVIDIGSNTIRLVLYRIIDGEIRQLLNNKESAGLAGYIDGHNRMTAKGIKKAISVLNEFLKILENIEVEEVFAFATASLRNIGNANDVLAAIKEACGLDVRVLTGDEEAVFDYFGALASISSPDGIMADIGGGSTELVFFSKGEVVATYSLPVGSLNMYTLFVKDIVPTKEEIIKIKEHVAGLLDWVSPPEGYCFKAALFGVGGTARASCQLSDELFDERSGYSGYPCKRIKKMLGMVKHDRKRLVSAIIKTSPERLHTLLPGLAILQAVSERYGCGTFSASPYGVREGFMLHMLEERDGA